MSTTQHTSHYNLPTFGDNPNDRPSWRGDFTDAMTKIDNQMYANATNITTATNTANDAKTTAQAAQTTADGAASAVSSAQSAANTANANLNAMGAGTVQDATVAGHMIRKTGGHAVWIGDSIIEAAGQTTKARTLINQAFGYTEHYYAVGGTGWLNAGRSGHDNFNAQINRAIADSSYNHDECVAVFVIGGVNDFPSGSSQGDTITSNVTSGISALVNEFTNATIYVGDYIGGNLSATYSIAAPNKYDYVYRAIRVGAANVTSPRVKVFKCYNWGGVNPNAFESDGLHFNNYGQRLFFDNLRQIIMGGEAEQTNSINYDGFTYASASDENKESWVESTANGEMLIIGCQFDYITRQEDIQGDTHTLSVPNIVTLPPWIMAYRSYYKPVLNLSNGLGGYTTGDKDGYSYLIAHQDGDGGPIKIDFYAKSESQTFTAGTQIRINFRLDLPAAGIVTS